MSEKFRPDDIYQSDLANCATLTLAWLLRDICKPSLETLDALHKNTQNILDIVAMIFLEMNANGLAFVYEEIPPDSMVSHHIKWHHDTFSYGDHRPYVWLGALIPTTCFGYGHVVGVDQIYRSKDVAKARIFDTARQRRESIVPMSWIDKRCAAKAPYETAVCMYYFDPFDVLIDGSQSAQIDRQIDTNLISLEMVRELSLKRKYNHQ